MNEKSNLTYWENKQQQQKKTKIKLTNMDYIFLCENGTSRFFYKNWMQVIAFKYLLKRK